MRDPSYCRPIPTSLRQVTGQLGINLPVTPSFNCYRPFLDTFSSWAPERHMQKNSLLFGMHQHEQTAFFLAVVDPERARMQGDGRRKKSDWYSSPRRAINRWYLYIAELLLLPHPHSKWVALYQRDQKEQAVTLAPQCKRHYPGSGRPDPTNNGV